MRRLSLVVVVFCSFPYATYAQSIQPVATLACKPPDGAAISEPIFYFELGFSGTQLISNIPAFSDLLVSQAAGTTYPSCTLGNGTMSVTLNNVQFIDSGAFAYGAGVLGSYDPDITSAQGGSSVTACYSSFSFNGTTFPASAADCLSGSSTSRSIVQARHGLSGQPTRARR